MVTVPPPGGDSPSVRCCPGGAPFTRGSTLDTEATALGVLSGGVWVSAWRGHLRCREVLEVVGCGLGISGHLARGRGQLYLEGEGLRAHLCCLTQEIKPAEAPRSQLTATWAAGWARPPGSPATCTLPGSPCDL